MTIVHCTPIYGPRLRTCICIKKTPLRPRPGAHDGTGLMKVLNSLKSAKKRHKNCRIVRRKGRVYVINKTNPRFKARQG